MNDKRICATKTALHRADLAHNTSIMPYSAEFMAVYMVFSANSVLSFWEQSTMSVASFAAGLARRAVQIEFERGDGIVMVKPAGSYLQIIREIKVILTDYPTTAYQVSGEFEMIHAGAEQGILTLKSMAMESSQAILCSGANIIISNFTPEMLDWLN